ncbi:MAG: hypothetical protein H0X72_04095 [Acidobacteria bacterium]|jgi:hypothetical protein|nr:hypothetical protein [Acidobacteriota bacterium]
MSASIPKLPNGDDRSGPDANRITGNGISGTASVKISDGQGREIFSQVNGYLKINFRDQPREKGESDANKNESEVERKDRQAIHQGKDSTEASEKTGGKNEKINDSANHEYQEPARKDNAEKSNNAHQAAESNHEINVHQTVKFKSENDDNQAAKPNHENDGSDAKNNNSSTKNNSRTAPLNNESRSTKSSGQPPAETPSNENQILKSPDRNQSAKLNNGTLRSNIEFNQQNKHQDNGTSLQVNKWQVKVNASLPELNRGRGYEESKVNNPNPANAIEDAAQDTPLFNKPNNGTLRPSIESNRQNEHQDNGISLRANKGQDTANTSPPELNRGRGNEESRANNPNPANAFEDAAQDTPLLKNRNQTNNNNRNQTNNNVLHRNAQNLPMPQTRRLNLTINNYSEIENYSAVDNHFADAPKNNSNSIDVRQNKFLGEVIKQIFRENDVYLSSKAINNLIEHHEANGSFRLNNPTLDSLPKEIFQLVETIENQILQTFNTPRISHQHATNQVVIEIPQSLDNQIQTAKNLLANIFGTAEAKHFSHLDIQQRMVAAIEIFFKDLPAGMPGNLRSHSAKEVLAGFLLARGLLNPGSRHSTASLLGMMQSVAADKISLAAMRDFGGLVKVLISDAAAAKSTANLEIAVQKFARILVAINCLDTVLTAVKLASQSQFVGGGVGRTLAIVQVYELINRLVLDGEQAMKEAATAITQQNAAKIEPDKNTRSVLPSGTIADLTETDQTDKKTAGPKNVAAESALRQFLEFNPMFAHDKFLSAFENYDNAQQTQKDFLNHHQIEIEQWLRSGNHRLVKDIDFEKPVGIVVERDTSDFFSATTARIVLVRDGSVQGWHFLKSFLVA